MNCNYKELVTVANGQCVTSTGKGKCKIQLMNSKGENFDVQVEDVLYIPAFHGNLLSVNKILKKNFKVIFKGETASFQASDGKEVGIAELSSGLLEVRQSQKAMLADCKSMDCQHYWHKVFGHRDIDAIKEMHKRQMVSDLKLQECGIRKDCEKDILLPLSTITVDLLSYIY